MQLDVYVLCSTPTAINLDECDGKDREEGGQSNNQRVPNLLAQRWLSVEKGGLEVILMQPAKGSAD